MSVAYLQTAGGWLLDWPGWRFEVCGANSSESSSMTLTDSLHLIQFDKINPSFASYFAVPLTYRCQRIAQYIFLCAWVIAETAVSASKRGFAHFSNVFSTTLKESRQ